MVYICQQLPGSELFLVAVAGGLGNMIINYGTCVSIVSYVYMVIKLISVHVCVRYTVYMHTYIHTYKHTYMHTYIHT